MVQYAVLIYGGESADLEAHDRHAAELEGSGRLAAAFALEPGATATSIRADGVTDRWPPTCSRRSRCGWCAG